MMRRFRLIRKGAGIVAEGVVFSDGTAAVRWLSENASTVMWSNIKDAMKVHGHDGETQINWIDHGEKGSAVPFEERKSVIYGY